jgi:hypothetical protein
MRFRFLSALIFPILITGSLQAQSARDQATRVAAVTGRVIDAGTQEPVVGATVQVIDTRSGAVADAEGRFAVYGLAPGSYRVRASAVGYEPAIRTDVVVSGVRPYDLTIELRQSPALSSTVVVRPDYFQKSTEATLSRQTFSNEEVRRLPGGFEDVVRAVSTLPGVARVSNGRNDLLVRGGAPSENLFLIDNIEAPNINHFGTQGSGGGPLSFVNLDFVRDVSFSTGGFGVKYGDKISSVLDIALRDGRDDRIGGKGTISASQFGLDLEGPFSGRGSFLFSARRSYLDLIFRAAGFSFVPEYWDFLGKADYRLPSGDRLSLLAIGAIDRVRQFDRDEDDRFDNSRILDNSQDQLVAGATWKHLFDGGYLTATLGHTVVAYRFRQVDTLAEPVFTDNSTEDEYNLRLDAGLVPEEGMEITFGAQGRSIGFTSQIALSTPGSALDIAPEDRFTKGGLYAQIAQRVFDGLRVSLGGRVDYFDGIEKKFYPTARLTVSQSLGELTSISVSAGRYVQAPSYIWLAANPINRSLRSIRADAVVAGVEHLLAADCRVSLEGYYKRYGDYPASLARPYLVLANTGAGFGGADEGFASFGLEPLASLGTGRAYGLELLLQKKLSEIRCYGSVGLSYNHSFFTAIDGIERPGNFDQRVIFNLAGGYRLNDDWEIGLKFRFATGRPYTPVDSTGDPGFGHQVVSAYNTLRLPAAHALDLRVDRRWELTGWSLITYVDVQNIYNRKNPEPPRWNARLNGPDIEQNQIGILPSIGVSAEF